MPTELDGMWNIAREFFTLYSPTGSTDERFQTSHHASTGPSFPLGDKTVEAIQTSLNHEKTSQVLPGFADLLGLWTGKLLLSSIESTA